MKIARQILGFHLMAEIDFWHDWNRFYCLYCEDTFSSKRKLNEHINFQCTESGKAFFRKVKK